MKILRPALAKGLGIAATTALLAVVVFRFAAYGHMYIAPDAPHGISDVVEFLLGAALMAILGLSLVTAVALAIRGPRENRVAAAWLLALCLLIAALVEPLHQLAAKWSV